MATIDALRDLIWARDGGLCGICKGPVSRSEMHMDHVQPRALAGPDTFENLRLAHAECNMRRGAGHPAGAQHWNWKNRTRAPALPRFLIRFPPDLLAELGRVARAEHRSLNNLVVHALREWLAEQKTKDYRGPG